MLEHLDIRNFALIENLSMDFHEGFNVITGETGAGKSIILGALGLLMGEKADSGAIRTGADEISVNAVLSVPDGHEACEILKGYGAEPEDGHIVIRRTVRRNGRSTITVQGQMLTRAELVCLADSLVDMHGQSEHQSLLLADKQMKIVDSYAGNGALLEECSSLYSEINLLTKERDAILSGIEEARRQADYLGFALSEIENARLRPGEDSELKDRIAVLGQFESIVENSSQASEKLKQATALLFDAQSAMAKGARADASLADYVRRIESQRIEVQDIVQGMSAYLGSVDYSETVVDALQERLSLIQKLKRKYGPEIEDVLAFANDARTRLELAENSDSRLEECSKAIERARARYSQVADVLSARRKSAAGELEKKVEPVLRSLGMPDAVFEMKVEQKPDRFTSRGRDSVDFAISANRGESPKALKEIASGGELSRVMLALKTVLAGADSIQTQVFDEIDTGIGGAVALSLAQCMANLARDKQVIAITHLAGIASRANTQFVVSKSVEAGRTYTGIRLCQGEDRVREIARMLSGDEESVSLEHARQMLGMNQA